MAQDDSTERDLLRRALRAGSDCMPIEVRERCADPQAVPPELAAHLESCAHCRAELDLLRSFLRAPNSDEAAAVRTITKRLRLPDTSENAVRPPGWKGVLQMRWLSPVVAVAGMLIAVAIGVEWRHGAAPQLNVPNQPEAEVLRSGSIQIIAPAGDLSEVPTRIHWQAVPGASEYQARLLEVDHSELWNTSTAESQAAVPAAIRSKIVPAKTRPPTICQALVLALELPVGRSAILGGVRIDWRWMEPLRSRTFLALAPYGHRDLDGGCVSGNSTAQETPFYVRQEQPALQWAPLNNTRARSNRES